MVELFLAASLFAVPSQQLDSTTFATRATADLVARAQARHAAQDTMVDDYTAMVRTRIDAGVGRRRFAVIPPFVAAEWLARISWARPNDLKIEMKAARSVSTLPGVSVSGVFDDPWFYPRGLGDTIRFVDGEIPEVGALHPFAASGPGFYQYEIVDSLSITLPERRVEAMAVRVEPRRLGPSLVAGDFWVDRATGDVIRMTFVFLGDYLWASTEGAAPADSAMARRRSGRANRILRVEADLEYGLHQAQHWMPYRQLVTLTVDIPWFINARIPVRFVTVFSDYKVNGGFAPVFAMPEEDSAGAETRCRTSDGADCAAGPPGRDRRSQLGFTRSEPWNGGRWEIHTPPRDSLLAHAWPDHLDLEPDAATAQLIRETQESLADLSQGLPARWMGRAPVAVAYDQFSDLFRFNRVQGVSLGAGIALDPGLPYTTVLASARFGFSDTRVTGSLVLRRDAPGGRAELGAWRRVGQAEPWTSGLGIGNSLNALFAGHDDADYHLVLGAGFFLAANHGALRDMELSAGLERHSSMATQARSALNDWLGGSGTLRPNPAATSGDFIRLGVSQPRRMGPVTVTLGAELLTGASLTAARGWGELAARFVVAGRSGALTARVGAVTGDSLPQFHFRVGGPQTVRGYAYGSRWGRGIWSAQLDFGLTRGSGLTPVVFLDAGDRFGSSDPLVSVGGGLSFLGGLARLNLSRGINPVVPLRFDLLFRAPR